MKMPIALLYSWVVGVLVLNGCAVNSPYRTAIDTVPCEVTPTSACSQSAVRVVNLHQTNEYTQGFVEFDDQGMIWDRWQLQAVTDYYNRIAGLHDVLIVVFAHGWHHNAAPDDNNVEHFSRLLSRLSQVEAKGADQDNRAARKILGVYLGWRGKSVTVPVLNNLTFWDRKSTAHRVGQQGVTEVLLKLEQIIHVKKGMDAAKQTSDPSAYTNHSEMVVVGHSFGGAVVYNALAQILLDRFIDSRAGKVYQGARKGFGDLVVLVNPAFEAMRFMPLNDIAQDGCPSYKFPPQYPKVAVLTSEQDYATRLAFPIGRFFSTVFENYNDLKRYDCPGAGRKNQVDIKINEYQADITAVGHFEPLLTHHLVPASTQVLRQQNFKYRTLKEDWSNYKYKETLTLDGVDLIHLGRTAPQSPYLNIRVDGELIGGHNDIWGERVVGFVRDLILISTLPESKTGNKAQ